MLSQAFNFLQTYRLFGGVNFEHDGKNFQPIDRFRYIEYDRDWRYQPQTDTCSAVDNIFNFNIALKKDQFNEFSYKL